MTIIGSDQDLSPVKSGIVHDQIHYIVHTGPAQSKKPRECDHEVCKVAADSSELCLGWLWSADGGIGDPLKGTEPDQNSMPPPTMR